MWDKFEKANLEPCSSRGPGPGPAGPRRGRDFGFGGRAQRAAGRASKPRSGYAPGGFIFRPAHPLRFRYPGAPRRAHSNYSLSRNFTRDAAAEDPA